MAEFPIELSFPDINTVLRYNNETTSVFKRRLYPQPPWPNSILVGNVMRIPGLTTVKFWGGGPGYDSGYLSLTCRYGGEYDTLWVQEPISWRWDHDEKTRLGVRLHYTHYLHDMGTFRPEDELNWHHFRPYCAAKDMPRWAARWILPIVNIQCVRMWEDDISIRHRRNNPWMWKITVRKIEVPRPV